MQHGSGISKAGAEPADHLRCQRDFRHKQDRALAAQQRLTHNVQIDLGFAAARHAVQQKGLRLAVQ